MNFYILNFSSNLSKSGVFTYSRSAIFCDANVSLPHVFSRFQSQSEFVIILRPKSPKFLNDANVCNVGILHPRSRPQRLEIVKKIYIRNLQIVIFHWHYQIFHNDFNLIL